MSRTFRNPILPGFYPDPSICRVGRDYYLVTSTFEYFPGLPVFHSRDLVHWRQIGHVLDRPSQLPLDGVRPSGGLYAPTLRYAGGVFYVVNTLVDGLTRAGNFIVTAADPAGPWSEPVWLENAPGIDPSLFFDEDGRAWYVGNRMAARSQYEGHTEIWLQELDLAAMRLTGEACVLWDGALKGAGWAEAPHLYKINGHYYLMIAEGGTGHNHAVTIARSPSITGPYTPNPRNPILTHRHLGLDYPIVGTGHADLVETQTGEWWMVLLAMRPYGGYFYNLGRETFLAPVRWEDGWPVVSPGTGRVENEYPAPDLAEQPCPAAPACDHFEAQSLALHWNFLRTPRDDFWSLSERPGYLRLRLRQPTVSENGNPSFVGRRQQHMNFTAQAALEFSPRGPHECAGLVLLQNSRFHFEFSVTQGPHSTLAVRLLKRAGGAVETLAEQPVSAGRPALRVHSLLPAAAAAGSPGTPAIVPDAERKGMREHEARAGRLYLRVQARGQAYSFYAASQPDDWRLVAESVDGRVLSTPVAGGFVGAYIGLYASSSGQPSTTFADFDWFEYLGEN